MKEEKELIPIFVPLDEIEQFPDPMEMPDDAGRLALKAKGSVLHGFRCKDITSVCLWSSNGVWKGFKRSLLCRYDGSMPHFNFMLRAMNNWEDGHNYIVLLPREDGLYVVFGNSFGELTLADSNTERQAFTLECPYQLVPFPYYDGTVEVIDCTGPELMKHLYGAKLK